MSAEYCAYPFLKEKSRLCDYEIATDRLASTLSVARHHIRHIPQEDLPQLMRMVCHANGSIREACAIGEAELRKLNTSYARYHIEIDRFVLSGDYIGASRLHMLCVEVKAVIRIMHQIQCEGKPVEVILFDFMNPLSNIFLMMYLYRNAQDDIGERELVSRSYI